MTAPPIGPLAGRSVVVTRAAGQSGDLIDRLEAFGAVVVAAPTIRIVEVPGAGTVLRASVGALRDGDWIVVTSPNGAQRVVTELLGQDPVTDGVRVAALGPATGQVMTAAGIVVDLIPERYVAEGLLDALPAPVGRDPRVVLARAAVARDLLPDGLVQRGWTVDVVDLYRTEGVSYDVATREAVRAAEAVTFTSSSTVRHFLEAMSDGSGRLSDVPEIVVCIGPVTAATARGLGVGVTAVASEHSVDGLVASLVEVLDGRTGMVG